MNSDPIDVDEPLRDRLVQAPRHNLRRLKGDLAIVSRVRDKAVAAAQARRPLSEVPPYLAVLLRRNASTSRFLGLRGRWHCWSYHPRIWSLRLQGLIATFRGFPLNRG